MADTKNQNHSRRKFLSLSFLAGASVAASKIAAQASPENGQEVMLLTKDGKLVAVDKSVLDTSTQKKQATKKDVLSWIHPPK